MINKLESAGLGFFVKANETHQKLGKNCIVPIIVTKMCAYVGKIPLRQLVYRVLDLPPSMRPLVYDFGQLNDDNEKDYIDQIVKDRCQNIPQIKGQADVIHVIKNVLVWSQQYMRSRKVCQLK